MDHTLEYDSVGKKLVLFFIYSFQISMNSLKERQTRDRHEAI